MKLSEIFSFLVGILLVMGALMFVFPAEGLHWGELSLHYKKWDDWSQPTQKVIVEAIEEPTIDLDSLYEVQQNERKERAIKDSIHQLTKAEEHRKWQVKLHLPEENPHILDKFFEALDVSDENLVRIVHYGDSQIEGDRISGFLRNKLQAKFGGKGVGFLSAYPLVRPEAVRQEQSDNWERHTFYDERGTTSPHKSFGVMAAYSRFKPHYSDSSITDEVSKAWVRFHAKPDSYQFFRMYYGNLHRPVWFALYAKDQLLMEDSLQPTSEGKMIEYAFEKSPAQLELRFKGTDSPDIYAISLESEKGVMVDNISMRGGSGTLFKKMDRKLLASQFKTTPVKLLILEYGGNALPWLESEKECMSFGKNFYNNIKVLQAMNPEAAVVVIGPADMSFNNGEKWETYELLEAERDALKRASFDAGAAYWDMYEAMGGKNSMPIWVEERLAASDYIHFSGKGAYKIAQLFYNALLEEYHLYKEKNPKS